MRVIRQEFGKTVYCDWSGRETFTRVAEGTAFCGDCGATDHDEVGAPG